MGHKDVETTMIYTHVMNNSLDGVRSPADALSNPGGIRREPWVNALDATRIFANVSNRDIRIRRQSSRNPPCIIPQPGLVPTRLGERLPPCHCCEGGTGIPFHVRIIDLDTHARGSPLWEMPGAEPGQIDQRITW